MCASTILCDECEWMLGIEDVCDFFFIIHRFLEENKNMNEESSSDGVNMTLQNIFLPLANTEHNENLLKPFYVAR